MSAKLLFRNKKYGNNAGIVSAGKNLRFFVHLIYYMRLIEKNQGLFAIFIAKIVDNFYYKIVAFCYGIVLLKVLFML